MDTKTQKSLREIIHYLSPEEKRHWRESGKPATGHIYSDINNVTKWLNAGPSTHN